MFFLKIDMDNVSWWVIAKGMGVQVVFGVAYVCEGNVSLFNPRNEDEPSGR